MTDVNFPAIPWRYYWCIEVGQSSVYIGVKKRVLGLFRAAIVWKHSDYIIHQGLLTDGHFAELEGRAAKIAEQIDPVQDVLRQLRRANFNVDVKIKKS